MKFEPHLWTSILLNKWLKKYGQNDERWARSVTLTNQNHYEPKEETKSNDVVYKSLEENHVEIKPGTKYDKKWQENEIEKELYYDLFN